ncbi:MAG TPA: bacillithiol system redox-active protein YtxJ [Flavobacteriia bacterium]|nr:bacillithiol system redox-active protein YtxJ [Flavobacteriia bacterium]
MGFLNTIFGKNQDKLANIPWKPLRNIHQLDTIINDSNVHTHLIFKHSTRCGISSSVLRRFEKEFDTSLPVQLYFLDLLSHREISNEIEQRFGVAHQSPQVLILKGGKVEAHASHYDILAMRFS